MTKIRLAIATEGQEVAQHFGRCAQYTLVDIENNNIVEKKVIENPGHEPGAIPQLLHTHQADYVISGGIGQRAQQFFSEFGIQPILGICGSINDTIAQFINGTLESGTSLCAPGSGKGQGLEKTTCDHPHDHTESPDQNCSQHQNNITTIAITSQGPEIDSKMDERFGRCQYFVVINTQTGQINSIQNENISTSGGAGTASAKKIADLGAQAIISGHFGPNAVTALNALDIKMYCCNKSTVKEALDAFKKGQLTPITEPTVTRKSGL